MKHCEECLAVSLCKNSVGLETCKKYSTNGNEAEARFEGYKCELISKLDKDSIGVNCLIKIIYKDYEIYHVTKLSKLEWRC